MPHRLKVTTPSDTEIVLERVFDAPRRLVFDALTTPELLVRWFGARGWRLVVCEVDLRVDGAWRFVSQGLDGAVLGHGGVYREVVPPARLVYTEEFDNQSYAGESLITQVLVERDGRTTLTSTLRYASREARDIVLAYPMARGVAQAYEKLDEVLAAVDDEGASAMNWTLEVVVVPVSDVELAKAFYSEQLGFNVDHDTKISEGRRIVQLTPPGSGCSIVVGEGVVPDLPPPGSLKGLQLVVPDIHKAHAQLVERGVDVSEVQVLGVNPRPVDDPLDNVGFVFFDDPDGNGWAVQQISSRA